MKLKSLILILIIFSMILSICTISRANNDEILLRGTPLYYNGMYSGKNTTNCFDSTYSNLNGVQFIIQLWTANYNIRVILTDADTNAIISDTITGHGSGCQTINILSSNNAVLRNASRVRVQFRIQSLFTVSTYMNVTIVH